MLWQLVVYAYLFYMVAFYLNNTFWIITLSFALCAGLYDLWKKVKEYLKYNIHRRKGIVNVVHKVMFFSLPLLTLFIIGERIDNVPATVVIGFLWALGMVVKLTSDYLYVNRINIERLTGRFAETRRTLFTIVKSIPIIGKRRIPFKALKGVSFKINTGMFGLLGPNGAGKSTMMRIITGILEQSYGTIWINGLNTKEYREELQSLIGFLPQEFGMYESMTSWEFLDYQAMLKGITDPIVRKERLEYVLKAVHMYERKDHKIGSFSGGMKQRIGIALILLHLPRILVVDEPTAGLDPRERIRFRNLLVELSRDRIVIFSTHIIEDIASSCNQVAVINRGELKYYGDPMDMTKFAENKVWVFDIEPEKFEMLDEKLIVNNMMNGDKIRVRYISIGKPYENAERVEANLEDAYLCLLKNL